MTHTALYPLLLNPTLHSKVWGGRRLATQMHKSLPDEAPYGEAWEVHDTATVANGALAGQTLHDVLQAHGEALVGTHNNPTDGLPLLAKLLDASDWLSVQVHPDDAQAQALENYPRGKTEAWVVLATEPGAQLVVGVQAGTSREAMAQAIRDNRLGELLVYANVKAGDVFFIPANTVHAIGPGILLYEIQQSCDITYRLYDWGRMGLDGKPRELHIEKGVQVSNVNALPQVTHIPDGALVTVVQSAYFSTQLHRLQATRHSVRTQGTFHALTCTQGTVDITAADTSIALSQGRSALIPAALDAYTLNGTGEVLASFQTV